MPQPTTLFRARGNGSALQRREHNGVGLADCSLGIGGAPPSGVLTRSTAGLVFYDDFNRADGALGGNWVSDAGTWAISSNQATNSSGGNYDRCRNTGVALADGVYQTRMKAINGSNYCGLRILAPSAADDFHLFMNGGNADKRLARAANTDTTIANITMTMDTNFHVHKLRYSAGRNFVYWFDRVTKLGTLGSPFNSSTGPTAAAAVGLMSYAGAALYDWVLVSLSHLLTVTGLTGTQAFRVRDAADVTIGASAAQSGGNATLDISTLVDGLITGYIELHTSTAFTSLVARYPASGNATDLCGGDIFHP